eukprot:TRINITY_DN5007_c0_g1_i1.p1 TRINITY_DN5007_c0_g1~~TRINITY_DN5007_c0_g1_i1.p1  ORF type:complete len:823 (-),score=154.18 TRINITY_DN5007_c0_g1_i1:46-2403(-)
MDKEKLPTRATPKKRPLSLIDGKPSPIGNKKISSPQLKQPTLLSFWASPSNNSNMPSPKPKPSSLPTSPFESSSFSLLTTPEESPITFTPPLNTTPLEITEKNHYISPPLTPTPVISTTHSDLKKSKKKISFSTPPNNKIDSGSHQSNSSRSIQLDPPMVASSCKSTPTNLTNMNTVRCYSTSTKSENPCDATTESVPKPTAQEIYSLSHEDEILYPNSIRIKFLIGEGNRLEVHISPKKLIPNGLAKNLDGINQAEYFTYPKSATWRYPIDELDRVNSMIKEFTENHKDLMIRLYPLPSGVAEMILKKTPETDEPVDLSSIPVNLLKSMFPFQLEGLKLGISMKGKVMLADDMGLGKTIQAIALAAYYRNEWPFLIICPSSVRYNWVNELQKWLSISADDINVILTGKSEDLRLEKMVTIISYDLVPRLAPFLKKAAFKIVIADESHYLKTRNAKRTQAAVPLLKKAKRTLLLTGTPALSRPSELFSQLEGLGWAKKTPFDSFKKFAFRYCAAHRGAFGWDYSGSSNLPELHRILESSFMIRRMKKDVLEQLPLKTRKQVFIEPSPAILKEIVKMSTQAARLGRKTMQYRELITAMYVLTGKAKIDAAKEYLKDLVEKGDKFIVFAHHMAVMDAIQDFIKESGHKYIRIDGTTPSQLRQELVNTFQNDEKCKVAILSITAAGQGITLNAAALAVFVELYWTPGVLLQAEDRIHRIGQTFPVTIHYLMSRKTLDDGIWPLLSRKMEILGRTLNGKNAEMELSAGEIRDQDIPEDVLSSLFVDDQN